MLRRVSSSLFGGDRDGRPSRSRSNSVSQDATYASPRTHAVKEDMKFIGCVDGSPSRPRLLVSFHVSNDLSRARFPPLPLWKRLARCFRLDQASKQWLPPAKGYVRILSSQETGMRRIQFRPKSGEGLDSLLMMNCFGQQDFSLFSRFSHTELTLEVFGCSDAVDEAGPSAKPTFLHLLDRKRLLVRRIHL